MNNIKLVIVLLLFLFVSVGANAQCSYSNPTECGSPGVNNIAVGGIINGGNGSSVRVTPAGGGSAQTLATWTGYLAGQANPNSMQWGGNPAIIASFAGQNQLNTIYENITAASATMPESASYVSMTSATGAASGNGPVSAYKMANGLVINCNAGSANCYGQNVVLTLASGLGAFQGSGVEIDINNLNHDYPNTGYGGVISWGLQVLSDSNYPVTAAILIATINTTYSYHEGIYFSTSYGARDYSILDTDNASYSYEDSGTHSQAGIVEVSASPIAFYSDATFSTAVYQDASTSPYGMVLGGTYATAAIYTGIATTTVALATKAGQSICLDGTAAACVSYSTSAHKWYFTNGSGANIMSMDDSGNMKTLGTMTPSTTP